MRMLVFMLALLMPHAASAMTFAPMVSDFSVMPGEGLASTFTLTNTDEVAHDYAASLYAVTLDAETGEPSFGPLHQDVAAWMALDAYNFSVAAGGEKDIALTVAPPEGTSADSLVVGLVVRELEDGEGVTITAGVSSLVFMTVGSPEWSGGVRSMDATPGLTSGLPVDVTVTIVNDGERVLQPYGTVTIRNTFGGEVATYDINPALRRIPAGHERAYTVSWGDAEGERNVFQKLWREIVDFRVGVFTAELLAAPYPGGEAAFTETTRVVVFPWRVFLVGGIAAGAYVFVRARR